MIYHVNVKKDFVENIIILINVLMIIKKITKKY